MRPIYYPQDTYTYNPDGSVAQALPSYFSPIAAVANGLAQLQGPVTGGTPLTLNGSLVIGGVGVLDLNRYIIIFSTGNDTGITFKITGANSQGQTISEVLTGAGAGLSVQSANAYTKIYSIVPSGTTASTVSAGTNGVAVTPPLPVSLGGTQTGYSVQIPVGATINFTWQLTYDNPYVPNPDVSCAWFPVNGISGSTSTISSSVGTAPAAFRCLINSSTPPAGVSCHILQNTGIVAE